VIDPVSRPDPVTRWAGFGLAAVGGLMLTLSGLCSLSFAGGMVGEAFGGGDFASLLTSVLLAVGVFGGPPMLFGYYAFKRGVRAWRTPPDAAGVRTDEAQLIFGALLVLASVGGLAFWIELFGLFRHTDGDARFYAVAFSAFGAFIAGLLAMLGLNLILGARPPTRRPPAGDAG
jgi:hypothetical protein